MKDAFVTGLIWAAYMALVGLFTLFFWTVVGMRSESDNTLPEMARPIAIVTSFGFALGWGEGMKGVRGALKTIGYSLTVAAILSLITTTAFFSNIDAVHPLEFDQDTWFVLGVFYAAFFTAFLLCALLAYFSDLTKSQRKQ